MSIFTQTSNNLADVYGAGSYDAGNYQTSASSKGSSSTSSNSSSSSTSPGSSTQPTTTTSTQQPAPSPSTTTTAVQNIHHAGLYFWIWLAVALIGITGLTLVIVRIFRRNKPPVVY